MGEKARREQHKNSVNCFEQIQEEVPYKTAALRKFASYLTNHPRKALLEKQGLSQKQQTPMDTTHECTSVGQVAKRYIHQLCADPGWCLEVLLNAMVRRDGWWEKVKGICAVSTTLWAWWILSSPIFSICCYHFTHKSIEYLI